MSKTACFITRNFGKYDPDSLKSYESIGGFTALRKALKMDGDAIADVLAAKGIKVYKTFVGEYMTSLEMEGFSVSLLRLDDELKALLGAPADTIAFKV